MLCVIRTGPRHDHEKEPVLSPSTPRVALRHMTDRCISALIRPFEPSSSGRLRRLRRLRLLLLAPRVCSGTARRNRHGKIRVTVCIRSCNAGAHSGPRNGEAFTVDHIRHRRRVTSLTDSYSLIYFSASHFYHCNHVPPLRY